MRHGEAKASIRIMSEWQWMSLWKCWVSFSAISSRLRNLQRLGLERGESQHGLHQWWITFQVASNPHQEFVSKHAGAGSHAGIAMQLPVKLSRICIHLLNCFKHFQTKLQLILCTFHRPIIYHPFVPSESQSSFHFLGPAGARRHRASLLSCRSASSRCPDGTWQAS